MYDSFASWQQHRGRDHKHYLEVLDAFERLRKIIFKRNLLMNVFKPAHVQIVECSSVWWSGIHTNMKKKKCELHFSNVTEYIYTYSWGIKQFNYLRFLQFLVLIRVDCILLKNWRPVDCRNWRPVVRGGHSSGHNIKHWMSNYPFIHLLCVIVIC